ncbi:MAG: hypothetical protein WC731_02580 [Candidatus Omnitrophota bacterium]|jgi:hypothetical protein
MDGKVAKELHDLWVKIEEKWCQPLAKDKRFVNRDKLLDKFRKDKRPQIINEVILANLILNNNKFTCESFEYEPYCSRSSKTIDLVYSISGGATVLCDVKTIKPDMVDSWEKFQKEQKYFPVNTHIELEQEWMGGEIYHNMRSARSAMLQYTLECESKLVAYKTDNTMRCILMFCGNGFHWHLDELEDFADFYFTGKHNPGDQFSEMEKDFMKTRNIVFKRNIHRFGYFEHKEYEVDYRQIVCPVQGPWITGRWKGIN